MSLINIIIEEIRKFKKDISEGIADRYAEKEFNIVDPNKEMERKALTGIKLIQPNSQQNNTQLQSKNNNQSQPSSQFDNDKEMGTYVGEVEDPYEDRAYSNIYMNPTSLLNFDYNVRALSDKNGNLFVAQVDGNFYHKDIAMGVDEAGIIKWRLGNAYDFKNNIQWYRLAKSNDFALSISYIRYFKEEGNRKNAIAAIKLVQKLHPQFNFIPEQWEKL